MGFLEKLLVAGGAAFIASAFRQAREAQAETMRRRNSPLSFDERISQSDFTALATEIAHRTPRVIGADVVGMTVVLDIRSISGLSSWQAEVDFNDYGRLTGNYWINTENEDSQIPEHFADALSAEVVQRAAAYQPPREAGEREQPYEQVRDRVSPGAAQSAPPGWYPTAEGQRYWNGSAWIYQPVRNDWSAHARSPFPQAARRPGASPGAVVLAWIIALLTVGYMLPWAVAMSRGTRNRASVGWINFLLGWTIIGWIVALVMASVG